MKVKGDKKTNVVGRGRRMKGGGNTEGEAYRIFKGAKQSCHQHYNGSDYRPIFAKPEFYSTSDE